ncbi:KEOPS complex subunit Cgi121 [Halobacterium yunchengense]|uniref:KEOPS complex subunit Cgi121 n=1 Tax=Halobacterium yunchengense TaxID=3108497 RepID=UPI00300AC3C2
MRLVVGTARVGDVDEFVAALGAVGDEHGAAVQAFDAAYVADRRHLAAAVERADRAFDRGENVAGDRAVEVLLYAAGRRQIREALEMGVGEGEQRVVVVVHDADGEGDETGAAAAVADRLVDAAVLGDDEALAAALDGDGGVAGDPDALRAFFAVSDAELAAAAGDLAGVVRERVALLDVEK